MPSNLPETLYVREDMEAGEETMLVAEESLTKALPDDDMIATVGVYELVRTMRVQREAKIHSVEEPARRKK